MSDEKKNPNDCAAYGCPMIGAHSSSMQGGRKWLCWLHFNRDAMHWPAITSELKRVEWLVRSIRGIRANYGTAHWADAYLLAKKEIQLAQRGDLLKRDSEGVGAWVQHLDKELGDLCRHALSRHVREQQQPLEEPFKKVSFSMPQGEA